ncbi:MAG: patatin-like phospholipase family protein [Planctomycetota bacterium]
MKRVLVVFSGGGMKGLAHIGALRVLRRLDLPIVAWAGTSVGALVAAYAASGMTVAEIENIGLNVKRRDIVDMDWLGMIWRRMGARAFNRGKRLKEFVRRTVPAKRFDNLAAPLFVNAVELASGSNVVFGLPGLRDVSLHDTIAASCSIPGIFPPVSINGREFVDGAVIDNLQLRLARLLDVDFVVAVNLRTYSSIGPADVKALGLVDIMNRGNDLTGQAITEVNLATRIDVPGVIVHPDVSRHHYLGFENTPELIDEGERATHAAFARYFRDQQEPGIWSRFNPFASRSRKVGNPFVIDESRCVRCGVCVVNNPDGLFKQAGVGAPVTVDRARASTHEIAPLKECPFGAIRVDEKLLGDMYGPEPPPHLLKLARDPERVVGTPPFEPPPGLLEARRAAGESGNEVNGASSSRRWKLLTGFSSRRLAVQGGNNGAAGDRNGADTVNGNGHARGGSGGGEGPHGDGDDDHLPPQPPASETDSAHDRNAV